MVPLSLPFFVQFAPCFCPEECACKKKKAHQAKNTSCACLCQRVSLFSQWYEEEKVIGAHESHTPAGLSCSCKEGKQVELFQLLSTFLSPSLPLFLSIHLVLSHFWLSFCQVSAYPLFLTPCRQRESSEGSEELLGELATSRASAFCNAIYLTVCMSKYKKNPLWRQTFSLYQGGGANKNCCSYIGTVRR